MLVKWMLVSNPAKMTDDIREPRQITRLEERIKVERRTLEYLLQGSELQACP
jgi:hypothetical protein